MPADKTMSHHIDKAPYQSISFSLREHGATAGTMDAESLHRFIDLLHNRFIDTSVSLSVDSKTDRFSSQSLYQNVDSCPDR
jgi:hypothetical protein